LAGLVTAVSASVGKLRGPLSTLSAGEDVGDALIGFGGSGVGADGTAEGRAGTGVFTASRTPASKLDSAPWRAASSWLMSSAAPSPVLMNLMPMPAG
jgi:hypothetical protein